MPVARSYACATCAPFDTTRLPKDPRQTMSSIYGDRHMGNYGYSMDTTQSRN